MANEISRLPEQIVEEFGPAMLALTEPQRMFILHYCDTGGIAGRAMATTKIVKPPLRPGC